MKMTKSPTPSQVRVLYTLSRGHFIHSRCLFLFQPFFLFNNFIHVFNFQMDSPRGPPATRGRGRPGSGGRSSGRDGSGGRSSGRAGSVGRSSGRAGSDGHALGRAVSIPGQGRASRSSTSSHSPGATDCRLDRRDSLADVMQTDLPSASHHGPGSADPPTQGPPPQVHTLLVSLVYQFQF